MHMEILSFEKKGEVIHCDHCTLCLSVLLQLGSGSRSVIVPICMC